jgi:tRNA modification GTPase
MRWWSGSLPRPERSGAPVIDSLRQKNLLERAVVALDDVATGLAAGMPVDAISVDLQEALHALGEIIGEVTSEDVLDAVFSGFCVGK